MVIEALGELGDKSAVPALIEALKERRFCPRTIDRLRRARVRFMKYSFYHMPFGKKEEYAKEIMKSDLERLAHLIKVCGFLMQTKVYLFWHAQ